MSMTPSITSHSKWTPSLKHYYGAYHSSVRMTNFSWHESAKLPAEWDNEYRLRRSSGPIADGNWTRDATLYTNNLDLIEFMINDPYYAMHIDYIATPMDTVHRDILSSGSGSVIFREKLYYNKFHFKISDNLRWNVHPAADSVNAVVQYIEDNFKDYKLSYPNGRFYYQRQYYYSSVVTAPPANNAPLKPKIPCVYTNDEAGIMLLKLSYGQELQLQISKVYLTNQQ